MEKTQQINLKITFQMREMLRAIGEFEGQDVNELIRSWIAAKVAEYRKDKLFQRELLAGHLKIVPELMKEE